jgi:LAO/AO transport system kinase
LNQEKNKLNISELADEIVEGKRRALAKGITLIESTLARDKENASKLLSILTKKVKSSIRIGISGVPGAGKSTFIEAFGQHVISQGNKIAVLAVDPSSPITGGSILGDKTRMPELAMSEHAFIRPSPSSGNLGGVTRKTRETITLCEAAGYNIILVETVGVGQSEIAVSEMTDFFVLILIAGGGDELQGIKKGIMEIADLILINKADGTNKTAASLARNEYLNALGYITPREEKWRADVLTMSSLYKEGIIDVWKKVVAFREALGNKLYENRKIQSQKWLWETLQSEFWDELQNLKELEAIKEIQKQLLESNISVREACFKILNEYKRSGDSA